jgi:O-antigen/teichoic acid export membrane protein
MPNSSYFLKASWTLIDQGIVSLGSFIVNVFLARQLAPTEYGTFALLWGGLLVLQMVNSSLILYPLSVKLVVTQGEQHNRLLGTSVALVAFACIPQCVVLSLALLAFGRGDILSPALAWFVLWQLQETLRRGLFAEFRHRTAIIGDAISYLGQVAIIGLIATHDSVNLTNALYCMAASSGLAALVQAHQLGLSLRGPRDFRRTVLEFWFIGRWALVNNLMSQLRSQMLLWGLVALLGAAAAASFQATQNVVNLVNPIIVGLCNVIPQTAAHVQARGNAYAWRSVRIYALLGIPPTFAYYIIALVAPGIMLRVFYGAGSPYLELSSATRLLVIAAMAGYGAEIICSFLHGVKAPGLALVINTIGTGTAILLALPLTAAFGLSGTFLALAISNVVRLVASQLIITRMSTDEPQHLA